MANSLNFIKFVSLVSLDSDKDKMKNIYSLYKKLLMRYILPKDMKSWHGQPDAMDSDALYYIVENRSEKTIDIRTILKSLCKKNVEYLEIHSDHNIVRRLRNLESIISTANLENQDHSSLILSVGDSTAFEYSLGKLPETIIDDYNRLNDRAKKLVLLRKHSIRPKLIKVVSRIFYNNLMILDTSLPIILGKCLSYHYFYKARKLADMEQMLRQRNPLKFDLSASQNIYEYKLKKFLLASALGMSPEVPWNGKYAEKGAFIIVNENEEIVRHNFLENNELVDYLFNNTYFDTPSTKRHGFGEIVVGEKENLLKLNLQVRFIS